MAACKTEQQYLQAGQSSSNTEHHPSAHQPPAQHSHQLTSCSQQQENTCMQLQLWQLTCKACQLVQMPWRWHSLHRQMLQEAQLLQQMQTLTVRWKMLRLSLLLLPQHPCLQQQQQQQLLMAQQIPAPTLRSPHSMLP